MNVRCQFVYGARLVNLIDKREPMSAALAPLTELDVADVIRELKEKNGAVPQNITITDVSQHQKAG